jgi:hypothetical protein
MIDAILAEFKRMGASADELRNEELKLVVQDQYRNAWATHLFGRPPADPLGD